MDIAIALALHVLAVVVWIGGVGFATMALLPALMRPDFPAERLAVFQAIEHRFAPIARGGVLLAGASGIYIVWRLDAWSWYGRAATWWMDAMAFVWVLFALLLFVLEPFVLHRYFAAAARRAPEAHFRRLAFLHWVLLILAVITILGAVAGSHGFVLR